MGDAPEALARKFGSLEHVSSRFGALNRAREPERRDQQQNYDRVYGRIGGAILSFFVTKDPGTEFRADDLRSHVAGQCGHVAPDSARRIASQMRRDGKINFELVSKPQSLFRVLKPEPHSTQGV